MGADDNKGLQALEDVVTLICRVIQEVREGKTTLEKYMYLAESRIVGAANGYAVRKFTGKKRLEIEWQENDQVEAT